jgi:hypothetical protein
MRYCNFEFLSFVVVNQDYTLEMGSFTTASLVSWPQSMWLQSDSQAYAYKRFKKIFRSTKNLEHTKRCNAVRSLTVKTFCKVAKTLNSKKSALNRVTFSKNAGSKSESSHTYLRWLISSSERRKELGFTINELPSARKRLILSTILSHCIVLTAIVFLTKEHFSFFS